MSNVIYVRPNGSFVGNYDSEAAPDDEAAAPYDVSALILLPARFARVRRSDVAIPWMV